MEDYYTKDAKRRKSAKGSYDFYRVTKMLSDIGAKVNTGTNPSFSGTMWCGGLYYGFANPNTGNFSTHMSPQMVEAKLAGVPRSKLYDLAGKFGASVRAEDVESVDYEERTRHIHFNLKDGRVVNFIPDPVSDPDMHIRFDQSELDETADAMRSFDWNTARWE